MKTKNNVQKTILRSAAVIISFVLISLTVRAQDFWKKLLANSSFNEIALAMVEVSDKSETSSSAESTSRFIYLEEANESTLELEDWMTNDYYFDAGGFVLTEEAESELELEDWMTDDWFFQVNELNEESLTLEAWMTSEKVWEI